MGGVVCQLLVGDKDGGAWGQLPGDLPWPPVTATPPMARFLRQPRTSVLAHAHEYACWCEKTMERKAGDISAEKELITETQILIKKLKGDESNFSW